MVASIHKADKFIAPGLGVLALIVYLATLSVGAYPGAPAFYAVQSLGLMPRMTPDHPLWTGLAWLIGKGGVQALNTLSAVCAALGVSLLYDVTRRAITACFRRPEESDSAEWAARIAAIGAALALAFCTPYWYVATRSHPMAFHVCLFLLAVHFFFRFVENVSLRTAVIFAFIYGLGMAEYATFIAFCPLFGIGLLFILWRREALSGGRAAVLVAALVAGLMLYLVATLAFYKTPGYEFRQYSGFFQVLLFMWRDQYWTLSRSLPQQGWLLVLILTVVPWITALAMARRAMAEEQDWTFRILHVVLTALCIVVLLNLSIAPWPQFRAWRLLVMPYLLVATTYGYLMAYWYVSSRSPAQGTERGRSAGFGTMIFRGLTLAGLLVLVWLPFRNHAESNGRQATMVNRFADALVSGLDGQQWLVTNGAWDHHLLLAAEARGQKLRVINLNRADDKLYQNYVVSLIDSSALRSRVTVSLSAFLQEWIRTEPDILEICAVQEADTLWSHAGLEAIPNGLVFLGRRDIDGLDIEQLVDTNLEVWDALQADLEKHAEGSGRVNAMARNMLGHMGRVANNLGFLLQDLDRPNKAFEMYSRARAMDPGNLSALLNQNEMIVRGFISEGAAKIQGEVLALMEGLKSPYRILDVVNRYGQVRMLEAYVGIWQEGARAEGMGRSVHGLKRAMQRLPEEERGHIKEMLAEVYFQEASDDESEMLYEELLVENPDNQRALIGMARLSMRKGDLDEARRHLQRAETVGVPASLMAMEWASLHVVKGEHARGRALLEKLLKEKPDLLRAWSMLSGSYISQRDLAGLRKCVDKLRKLAPNNHIRALSEGHLALLENRAFDASAAFEEALSYRPNDVSILEILLRLDMLFQREADATRRVRRLLTVDPDNVIGNRMLGALHIADKQYELAAESLKRVVNQSREDPTALNDLAWVLHQSGLYEEAEGHVREALKINEGLHQAWDTLGVILMSTDRRDEAKDAFARALSLNENSVSASVRLMKIMIEDGERAAATTLLSKWLPNRDKLSPDAVKEIDAIAKKLEKP